MNTLPVNIAALVRNHLEANQASVGGDAIHARGGRRGGLLRLPLGPTGTVVVKLWRVGTRKERIKLAVRLSNGWREWRMHQFVHRGGVQVPAPLGFCRLTVANGDQWEVMAIEDLGATERGLPYLKKLISAGMEADIAIFEEGLIAITTQIARLGVVDSDHQLNNFLVDDTGRLLRIDFECARRPWRGNLPAGDYAEMIARLLASHVYAVQPDVRRTERLAETLYGELGLDGRVRAKVSESVNDKLEYQHRKVGVASAVTLPS